MITQDEIDNGCDVFPLKFLHMKNHSNLILWKDVFSSLILQKSDLQQMIEFQLRTKMIQLREDFLSKSIEEFVSEYLYFIHVIREWILYLEWESSNKKDMAEVIKKYINCDWKIVDYLYDNQGKSLDTSKLLDVVKDIDQYLQCLCNKVDVLNCKNS